MQYEKHYDLKKTTYLIVSLFVFKVDKILCDHFLFIFIQLMSHIKNDYRWPTLGELIRVSIVFLHSF